MTNEQALLSDIRAFLAETGMGPTTFGARAVNNGHLVKRLEGGKTINLSTMRRVKAFIRDRRRSTAVVHVEAAQ